MPRDNTFQSAKSRNPYLYERHHDALFVAHKLLESQPDTMPNTAIIARGELGHAHPDLSVHLYLSPADARISALIPTS